MPATDSLEDIQYALLEPEAAEPAARPEEVGAIEDQALEDIQAAEPVEVADASDGVEVDEPPYSGPRCTKCEAPLPDDQLVCCRCGFCPSMGIAVDLDAEWEVAMNPESNDTEEPQTALEEFLGSVPTWAWPVIGSNVAILAVSLAGRLLLPSEAALFNYWGAVQLVWGLATVVALHITCVVMTASSDPDMGVVDLIVNPLKAWFRRIARLPEKLWLVIGASNGIALAVTAVLIVGGIPWHRLGDLGIETPTKTTLVEAITSAEAGGPSKDQSLDDAVVDFAGQSMPGDQQPEPPKKPAEPKPRVKADCLIIGFNTNEFDEITEVLIATDASGRLVYAGKLVPELPPAEKVEFQSKLKRAKTGKPLVKTGQVATWVKPRFPCRVSYAEQATNGRLLEMEWEELLPEIGLPW